MRPLGSGNALDPLHYIDQVKTIPVPDHEEQCAAFMRMETANAQVVHAALAHSTGLRVLEMVRLEVRSGQWRPEQVANGIDEAWAHPEKAQIARRLLRSLRRHTGQVQRPQPVAWDLVERFAKSCGRSTEVLTAHRLALRLKNTIVRSNLGLAIWAAKRSARRGFALEDVLQEGNIGLIRAVEKFDWRRGVKFSTYALYWIRQAMTRAVDNSAATIRVPVWIQEELGRIRRGAKVLEQDLARPPSPAELADFLGMALDRLESRLQLMKTTKSLDRQLREDEDAVLGDMIADPDTVDVMEKIHGERLRTETLRALATLSAREELILRLRFGIDAEPHKLEEIGQKLARTRERVRQIEARALLRLRDVADSRALHMLVE